MRSEVIQKRKHLIDLRREDESRESFMKAQLAAIFEEKVAIAIANFEDLEPKQQWDVLLKMLPYLTPKLTAVSVESRRTNAIEVLMDRLKDGITDAKELK